MKTKHTPGKWFTRGLDIFAPTPQGLGTSTGFTPSGPSQDLRLVAPTRCLQTETALAGVATGAGDAFPMASNRRNRGGLHV